MDEFDNVVSTLDDALNTSRKRHIIGGIMLSISLLFGGLAFTAMTIKDKENDNEQ